MSNNLFLWIVGLAAPLAAQSVPIFDDVPSYYGYYNHVNMMRLRFVTTGCTFIPSNYCPNEYLTRGQAAVLIIRSIYSATTGNPEGFSYNPYPQYFSDVPSSHPQYVYIQKMAELGITSGCQTGLFCPDDPLNYAQIATFAIRARMIREFGSIFALDCGAQPGTFASYPCNPSFPDVTNPQDFFFPYVQKANQLIGWQSRAHDCWVGGFCPLSSVVRGNFAYYAVSLIMNATSPSVLPNGGNLPVVLAPNNPSAGMTMSCDQAQNNLYSVNRFVTVDANNVYAEAGTNFGTWPQSPSLWITYAWRQLLGPNVPYPSTVDGRVGSAANVDLRSANFALQAGQTYTQNTKHGAFSGCISPPPADYPYIASTRTVTLAQTTQTFNSSPPLIPLTVDTAECNRYSACSFTWLSGTTHTVSAPASITLGATTYQFTGWLNGPTSSNFTYTTPSASATLTANYVTTGTVTSTITTSPVGLTVVVDGSSCLAPCQRQWTPGTSHTIGVNSPQGSGGARYRFLSWNDGGGQTHSITAASTTYTATFATDYLLTTAVVSGSGSLQLTPSSPDGYYATGSVVQLSALAAAGQIFAGFGGALSGTATPQNLSITGPRSVSASFSTPSFSLSSSPSSRTIPLLGSASYTLSSAASAGFSGTISFAATGLPSGVSASFTPPSITGSGSTTLMLTVGAGAPAGTFTVSVSATSGTVVRTVLTLITIQPASAAIMLSPAEGSILTNNSALFAWSTGSGVTEYGLALGATPGSAEYYNAGTGQSRTSTVTIPATTPTGWIYATVRSMIAGAWQTRTYGYHLYATSDTQPTSSATEDPTPFVYNDEIPRMGAYQLNPNSVSAGCIDPTTVAVVPSTGITARWVKTPSDKAPLVLGSFDIEFVADSSAVPGLRTFKAVWDGDRCEDQWGRIWAPGVKFNITGDIRVFDAMPEITALKQEAPEYPGGPFYLELLGKSFGAARGTISVCSPVPDTSPCSNTPEIQVDYNAPRAAWQNDLVRVLLIPSPNTSGTFLIELASLGASGFGFQGPPTQQNSGRSNRRQISIASALLSTKLIEFGWGNVQEVWKATTFASNGETPIGPLYWRDPAGDGNVTVNEPVTFRVGADTVYIKDIVLRADPSIRTAELEVVVSPNDFSFSITPVTFVNGQATIPNINLTNSLPNSFKNATYQLSWRIRFTPAGAFQQFKTTSHKVYIIRRYVDPPASAGLFRITTKRLEHVSFWANGIDANDLDRIARSLNASLLFRPGFSSASGVSEAEAENIWMLMDTPRAIDCFSISGLGAAQLQQLGFVGVGVEKAFPTGAEPPGDTDAQKEEVRIGPDNQTYNLTFEGNSFEGFIYLSAPDVSSLAAITVYPNSNGLLSPTGCVVSPNNEENRIRYRVLTFTYGTYPPPLRQAWGRLVGTPPNTTMYYLPDAPTYALPNNSCPPTEAIP